MGLFKWFKPKSKVYIHVFLEKPLEPTRELANDLARTAKVDLEGVPDSRFFIYSIDSWPANFVEYAEAMAKKHGRYPSGGTVATTGRWGMLKFEGGETRAWGIAQMIGPIEVKTEKVSR